MPAVIATGKNLKRVRVFLGKDGQKYEGTIEDYHNPKNAGNNTDRHTGTDRLSGTPKDTTKEENK
jgi:hypothetical protein